MTSRVRVAIVSAVLVLCLGLAVVVVVRGRATTATNPDSASQRPTARIEDFAGQPRIVFRNTGIGAHYGQVAVASLAQPGGARAFLDAHCERLDAVATRSACMFRNDGIVTTYSARIGTPVFRTTTELPISGLASRTRLSADGKLVSTTTFVAGDSYLSSGFSTRTHITDLATGVSAHLEDFAIIHAGEEVRPVDRNLWGVTFAGDDRTFYVTVAWGGVTWLARGDLVEKRLATITSNAECPALSPDGTRVAYKKRVGPPEAPWRFVVYDLRTGAETMTAETRSVDDQAMWIDEGTLGYAVPRAGSGLATSDVWSVPADGSGQPILLVPDAFSPAVLRS